MLPRKKTQTETPVPLMCGCPRMPVSRWYAPGGELIEERQLSLPGVDADAGDFLASGAVVWQILCPTCHRIYAEGILR